MSDIVLSPAGEKHARTQYRVFEYLKFLVQAEGLDAANYHLDERNKDHYLGDILQCTDILEVILRAMDETPPTDYKPTDEKLELVIPEHLDDTEAIPFSSNFSADLSAKAAPRYVFFVQRAATHHSDAMHQPPKSLTQETYLKFLDFLFDLLIYIEQLEKTPKMDWNDDKFVQTYVPNKDEVKLIILFDASALQIFDINADLKKEPGMFGNGLWLLYIVSIVGNVALAMVAQTIPYYVTSLGGVASDSSNLSAAFNFVQLFFSPLWLWLSEIIGRKPIYAGVMALHTLISGLLPTITAALPNNRDKINFLIGARAISGIGAIIVPMGFTIASDLATPKSRAKVLYAINACAQAGGVFGALGIIFIFTGPNYDPTTTENASLRSFQDTCWTNCVINGIAFIGCLFLRESCSGAKARMSLRKEIKRAQKLGQPVPESATTSSKAIKRDSWGKTLVIMCKNPNLILLFMCYIMMLIGSQLTATTNPYLSTKAYGFTDAQFAKQWNSWSTLVSCACAIIFGLGLTGIINRKLGEVATITISLYFSMVPSVLRFAIDVPAPYWLIMLPFNTIAMVIGDATLIQFVSMFTTPRNRGTMLGIFQIGNSVGRALAGFLGGAMYDWSWRDSSILFTLFHSVALIFLAVARPPLQRTDIDKVAALKDARQAASARV